jgi:hypothetical protein
MPDVADLAAMRLPVRAGRARPDIRARSDATRSISSADRSAGRPSRSSGSSKDHLLQLVWEAESS